MGRLGRSAFHGAQAHPQGYRQACGSVFLLHRSSAVPVPQVGPDLRVPFRVSFGENPTMLSASPPQAGSSFPRSPSPGLLVAGHLTCPDLAVSSLHPAPRASSWSSPLLCSGHTLDNTRANALGAQSYHLLHTCAVSISETVAHTCSTEKPESTPSSTKLHQSAAHLKDCKFDPEKVICPRTGLFQKCKDLYIIFITYNKQFLV